MRSGEPPTKALQSLPKAFYRRGMDATWRGRVQAVAAGLTAMPGLAYLCLTADHLAEGGSVGPGVAAALAFGSMFFALAVGVWRRGVFSHYLMTAFGLLCFVNQGPWWFRTAVVSYGTSILLCLLITWPRQERAASTVPGATS